MNTSSFSYEYITLNRRGEVAARSPGQALCFNEELGGGVGLEMVSIPGGSFQMGSLHEGGYADERPVHPVFLAGFWLGKHPVTQAQWQAVMGSLPACRFHGPERPVESISWKDALAFCRRLSQRSGRAYGLPAEAQWEYACRAGTATPFSLGETITTEYANYVGEHRYRDEPPGVYRHGTTPAGSFPPNPWGLFDMHGNVWEYCADRWSADYQGAPVNGLPGAPDGLPARAAGWGRLGRLLNGPAPEEHPARPGGFRVARGGSWHEIPGHCRSATRLQVAEDEGLEYFGLRVMGDFRF